MKRTISLVGILTALTLSLGFSTPAIASTGPFGSKTPSQILVLVAAAMREAGSVHLSGTLSVPGLIVGTETLDSANEESRQIISSGAMKETDLVFGTSVFIKGNAADFVDAYRVENSPLISKWILVPASNPNYANTLSGELFGSLTQKTVQLVDPKNLGIVLFEKQRVMAIEGELPASGAFPSATQTVYVSPTSPYLPIGYGDKFDEQGEPGTALSVFSKWGESVHAPRPTVFVTATNHDLP
jgi:hypothetical protein